MIKKILIWIFTLVLLGFSVSALGDISINPNADIVTASVTDQVSDTLVISNSNLTEPRTVNLPSTVTFSGSGYTLSDVPVTYNVSNSLVVGNQSSESINYTFTVPSDAYATAYSGIISFASSSEDYDNLTISLTVNSNHNIAVNDITLEIAQGQSGTATLTLTNNGNVNETATTTSPLTLTSTTSSNTISASIANISLPVNYKESASTTVSVNVPADQAKESYTNNITISYGGTTVESVLIVNVVDPIYSLNTGNVAFSQSALNETVSKTFSVENTGNTILNNIILNSSKIDGRYSFTLNETGPFKLEIGESIDIKADVLIPYEERRTGDFSIGTIDVSSDEQNFTSAYNVHVDVEPALSLKDFDILIDDSTENDVQDEEKIDDKAEPGSEIELKFILENTFSEESDIDIDDITITVTLIDSEDEEVEELDIDVGDLEAEEDSNEESVIFELDLDVQDGKYTLEIEIEGDDANGITREIEWTVYFELEKKSHDVIVYKAYLTPETVKCGKSSTLKVELMNIGEKTENDARLTIVNEDLDVNVDERDIELSKNPDDKDNTYTHEMLIGTEDIGAETYPITIKAYYDEDITDDIETIDLIVEDCPSDEPEEDETTVVVQQPDDTEDGVTLPTTGGEEIPTTTEISFMESGKGIALLIAGNIVVLAVVIFFVAKFFLVPKIPKP